MPGIIIHELKAVYWPIPKNACTTLKTYYADMMKLKYDGLVHDAPFEYTDKPIHGYYNFAIVRNPIDRLCSLFKNKVRPDRDTDAMYLRGCERPVFERYGIFHNGMNFDEFVSAIVSIRDPDPHFDKQVNLVPEGVDVSKMENYWQLIAISWVLPKLNSSGSYHTVMSKETKDMIYEHYKEDFIKFGYDR